MVWYPLLTTICKRKEKSKNYIYRSLSCLLGSPKTEGKKSYQRSGLIYSDGGCF